MICFCSRSVERIKAGSIQEAVSEESIFHSVKTIAQALLEPCPEGSPRS